MSWFFQIFSFQLHAIAAIEVRALRKMTKLNIDLAQSAPEISGVRRIFQWGGLVTSHRDDLKCYVILRHHDVTSLAVSIYTFNIYNFLSNRTVIA